MSRRGAVFGWCAERAVLTLTVAASVGWLEDAGYAACAGLSQQREAARQQWRHLRRHERRG